MDDDGAVRFLGTEERDLPDEFVLRELRDVDLSAPSEVVAFVAEYGAIPRRMDAPGEPFEGYGPVVREWDGQHVELPEDAPNATHVLDVQAYLIVLRAAVNHWLRACEGSDLAPAWNEEPAAMRAAGDNPAWLNFTTVLNAGLDAFRVRVEWTNPITETSMHRPLPDLFSAACLQLFNLMQEDVPIRRCANEPCGRPFIRQQGRAEFGQHRTSGVTYCSRSCARAQANREYRRRKRQESKP